MSQYTSFFTRSFRYPSSTLYSKNQGFIRKSSVTTLVVAAAAAAVATATTIGLPASSSRMSSDTDTICTIKPNKCSSQTAAFIPQTTTPKHHFATSQNSIMTQRQQQKNKKHKSVEFPKSWDSMLSSWQRSFLTVVHCEAQGEEEEDPQQQQYDDFDLIWKNSKNDTSFHYEKVPLPDRTEHTSHIIFGQLLKPGLIDRYEVYRRVNDTPTSTPTTGNDGDGAKEQPSSSSSSSSTAKENNGNDEVVVAVLHFGQNLDGHAGIVHGGVVSLLFDDAMGFAYEVMGIKMAFTANLVINFRKPVPAGCNAIMRVHHTKTPQGQQPSRRKVFFEAQLTSLDGKTLYAEGTSLYIIPRSAL